MIVKVGKSEKGDRTMFDYLMNMCELFDKVETLEDLKKEFNENSSKILEEIKLLKAKKGRATYYDGKEIGHDDPWMCFS